MSRWILSAAAVLVLASASHAEQYKVGDRVTVIKDELPLQATEEVVDRIPVGETLTVTEIDGKRLRISRGKPGWTENEGVVPLDQASRYFTTKLDGDPTNATWRFARAKVAIEKRDLALSTADLTILIKMRPGETSYWETLASVRLAGRDMDGAIEAYSEAIRLTPDNPGQYHKRGYARLAKADFDGALADFSEEIRLNPKDSDAYIARGIARHGKLDYEGAISDNVEAIRLGSSNASTYSNVAWLMATARDAKFRNGEKSVEYAKRAVELRSDKTTLASLAAAYAEAGDFDEAIKWQTKVVEITPKEHRKIANKCLELLKQRQPLRE